MKYDITLDEFKVARGIKIPFKEVYDAVKFTFPNWREMLLITEDTDKLAAFLTVFRWSLLEFVGEIEIYEELSPKYKD